MFPRVRIFGQNATDRGIKVPDGPDWLHEIKYSAGERSRPPDYPRGGYTWADRFPSIVEAARRNRHKQLVVDGEAVVLGVDGIADFNALHSRRHDDEVQLYAFDIMALDGDDLRGLSLSMRKIKLARLLARCPDGIFAAEYEPGEIGPDLFEAACRIGLEGLVSKRADRPYRAGRSKDWIKVKNRKHPAYRRVQDWC